MDRNSTGFIAGFPMFNVPTDFSQSRPGFILGFGANIPVFELPVGPGGQLTTTFDVDPSGRYGLAIDKIYIGPSFGGAGISSSLTFSGDANNTASGWGISGTYKGVAGSYAPGNLDELSYPDLSNFSNVAFGGGTGSGLSGGYNFLVYSNPQIAFRTGYYTPQTDGIDSGYGISGVNVFPNIVSPEYSAFPHPIPRDFWFYANDVASAGNPWTSSTYLESLSQHIFQTGNYALSSNGFLDMASGVPGIGIGYSVPAGGGNDYGAYLQQRIETGNNDSGPGYLADPFNLAANTTGTMNDAGFVGGQSSASNGQYDPFAGSSSLSGDNFQSVFDSQSQARVARIISRNRRVHKPRVFPGSCGSPHATARAASCTANLHR